MNLERTIHHESITLSKRNGPLPVLNVVLKTTTTYLESKDHLLGNQQGIVPLPATDSHLLSILSKYNMTSLLVSVASSSSMQMIHDGLPVGTLIRYRNDTLLAKEPHDYHNTIGPSPKDQMSLLKILSHHGLMCHNVQQEPFRNGNMHALLNHYDNTVVLMLPNDAYSLCHSKTLMEQIINVSPCRDFYGIYSQFDANLNHDQVTDKASWVKVEKVPPETRTNSTMEENDDGYAYSIERAIAFSFWPYEEQGETLNLASILGGHVTYKMQACPLSKTSVLMVQQGTHVLQEQDFTNSALDMNQDIPIHLFQEEDGYLKIERRIQRNNGISHKGRLYTKVYYDGSSRKCSNDLIHFTLVDVYPTIVLPLFHSLRIYLVEVIRPNVTNTQYLNIQELNHTLSIQNHGLSSLTLNYQLPVNASLFVEMEYLPTFPSFESFPADPNRGFDIPPSFVSYMCPMSNMTATQPQMVFSNALLVMPPVPDLSMPYNVISITSTFFALIIGTIINVTIKRANQSLKDQYNGAVRKRGIDKLKDFIVRIASFLKQKRNALVIQRSHCHSSHDKTD